MRHAKLVGGLQKVLQAEKGKTFKGSFSAKNRLTAEKEYNALFSPLKEDRRPPMVKQKCMLRVNEKVIEFKRSMKLTEQETCSALAR